MKFILYLPGVGGNGCRKNNWRMETKIRRENGQEKMRKGKRRKKVRMMRQRISRENDSLDMEVKRLLMKYTPLKSKNSLVIFINIYICI